MSDKAFEVRGPRAVAVKLEGVTDAELIDIAREQALEEVDIDVFIGSTSYYEARGATYAVFSEGTFLLLTDEEFFERYTPAPAEDAKLVTSEATEGGVDGGVTGWRDREMRVTALQQAVAISARGNAANTDAILKQAKQIEDYLVKGTVTPETPDTP